MAEAAAPLTSVPDRRHSRRWRWVLAVPLPVAFAILGFFINVIGLISLLLVALGLITLMLIALTLAVMFALRAAKLRKRPVSATALLVPALALLCGLCGLGAGYFGGPPPVPAEPASSSSELAYICTTDQGDRITLRWLRSGRDSIRLARVLDMQRSGLINGPVDQLRAALVLQHGTDSMHYRLAHELAKAAYDNWVETPEQTKGEAEWLMKATYDRWMTSLGKPQVYGTQKEFNIGF